MKYTIFSSYCCKAQWKKRRFAFSHLSDVRNEVELDGKSEVKGYFELEMSLEKFFKRDVFEFVFLKLENFDSWLKLLFFRPKNFKVIEV